MKKQKIQMILILVVLVLCIGAYFLVSHMAKQEEQKEKDSETEGQTTIAKIDADKIDAFSYEVDGKTYSYTKDGDEWKYDDDNSLQLDADNINTMLGKLNGVIALETLDSYDSLSDYGLDKPQNTITVSVGNKTTTFYIGDYNDMVSEYYLKMEGDDSIYLVDSTLKDAFSKTANSLVKEEDTRLKKQLNKICGK